MSLHAKRRLSPHIYYSNYKRSEIVVVLPEIYTDMSLNPFTDIDFCITDIEIQYEKSTNRNIVRIFGITKAKYSICCVVDTFKFTFLLKLPYKDRMPDYVYETLQKDRNVRNVSKDALSRSMPHISMVDYNTTDLKEYLYELCVNDYRYIKDTANRLLTYGDYHAYDVDIDPVLKFCTATNIKGCCWMTAKKRQFKLIHDADSRCHVTIQLLDWRNGLESQVEKCDIAPYRVLGFDIECAIRKAIFPEPKIDPVIQIGITTGCISEQCEVDISEKYLLTLGTCSLIDGVKIQQFTFSNDRDAAERKLLEAFVSIVTTYDPDIITGYNINTFDIPYLLERGKHLQCHESFFRFSRLKSVVSCTRDVCTHTKAIFSQSKIITMPGRICFDMLQVLRKDYNLTSYKLDSVAKYFIGDKKDDVPVNEITRLFEGTAEDRKRLAEYCIKDVVLVIILLNKLMSLVNYIELSKIYGVSMSSLLNRGQQFKVKSMLYRYIKCYSNFIIPYGQRAENKKRANSDCTDSSDCEENNESAGNNDARATEKTTNGNKKGNFKGATVMEPILGLHEKYPTVVLDFSSLYPSIIQRYNVCFSTRLNASQMIDIGENNVSISPVSAVFVKPHIRRGILPDILTDLIRERTKTKQDIKKCTDKFKKKILNGKQLALKISANSVYGFTGDPTSNLYCVEISSSVTGYGRQMLRATKEYIERTYAATVIYGDTDSVMFHTDMKDDTKQALITKAIAWGKHVARDITTNLFQKPISLEFEKVLFPIMLCSKKRYCGLAYTDDAKQPKMDIKGLQAVRRDSCSFVRQTQSNFMHYLLTEGYSDAIAYVQKQIKDLRDGCIPIDDLIMTKLLRDNYKTKLEHAEVQKKMLARDSSTAPQVGERVMFVYVDNGCNKAYEKAEDPVYVQRHSLPLDYTKYLDRLKTCFIQMLDKQTLEELFKK